MFYRFIPKVLNIGENIGLLKEWGEIYWSFEGCKVAAYKFQVAGKYPMELATCNLELETELVIPQNQWHTIFTAHNDHF